MAAQTRDGFRRTARRRIPAFAQLTAGLILATLVSACGSDSSVSVYIPVTRSPSAAVTPPSTTTATTVPTATSTGVPSPTATTVPATAVPSATATRQPTRSATATVPPAATATASPSPTSTQPPAATSTATVTQPPAATSTATVTQVPPSPTATASFTVVPPTRTVTVTATTAPSATVTVTTPPTATAIATASATVTATGVPTGTAAATATATVTATHTAVPPTNTPTATFTPTATPTVDEGAPCGDRVLQPGQTCAECPADCVVGPCTSPGAPTQAFVIELENEFGFDPTTATVVFAYNSTKLSIPGTGAVPSVRQRVVAPAPLPQAFTPNDMDYAVRVLISRNTPLATLFTATFDRCSGAPAPTLDDVACTVEGCAQQGGAVPGCSCFARLP